MKLICRNLLFISITLMMFSCKDFIEEDISHDTITLNAPANNLQTVILTHTFWWEHLKGAEQYKMQVVEGTFSSTIKLVLDTTIGTNKFDFTLYPGTFQWRVKGTNNGSETVYTTFTLVVDSTNDITAQTVVLNLPNDNVVTNASSLTLRWNSIYIADNYNLDIRENNWSGNSVAGFPISTTTNEYTVTLADGIYEWGVQGENSVSNSFTGYSKRTLTIDTGVPDTVALSLPLNNTIIGDSNYTYKWSHPTTDNGSALTDSIFFYSDINGSTLYKSGRGTANNYTDSLGSGIYYWRVRSTDEAGNVGGYTTMRKFTIQ
ncbi:MAG: hypothetical protein AB7O47_12020 [Flavobacteriales bacterium]